MDNIRNKYWKGYSDSLKVIFLTEELEDSKRKINRLLEVCDKASLFCDALLSDVIALNESRIIPSNDVRILMAQLFKATTYAKEEF